MSASTVVTTTIAPSSRRAPHLDVRDIGRDVAGTTIVSGVSFTARRGEVIAIAGGSGAGKSTLLDLIAGRFRPDRGSMLVDGHHVGSGRIACGYVPQDDIVHGDLPLLRTLEYAAALRIGAAPPMERRAAVLRALDAVGLSDHVHTRTGSLSGGQRKRACIAVELLTSPELFLLDEPTSGLDPATAAELLTCLHDLAALGTTVVLTTHAPSDLDRCDRVVLLAPGGRHVFTGSADAARRRFGVTHLADAYALLGEAPSIEPVVSDDGGVAPAPTEAPDSRQADGRTATRPGWLRQWTASTARTAELVTRNRLTLAILLGSPVFVIAMLAAVFRPGTVDTTQPAGAAQMVFWVVFSAFFFGLTYGLLQIVTEREIFRRERAAGLRVGAYVASKATVLAPFLAVVDVAMLWVLDRAGQLPSTSIGGSARLWGVLALVSLAALGIGLAASALVRNASQATLALPMLCFPQVLLAGAIVPTSEMALPGRMLSATLVGRWGFEAFGRVFGLGHVDPSRWPSPGHAVTFDGSATTAVVVLIAIGATAIGTTVAALRNG